METNIQYVWPGNDDAAAGTAITAAWAYLSLAGMAQAFLH